MQVFKSASGVPTEELVSRPALTTADISGDVRTILDTVRADGDEALRRYTEQFDGVKLDDLAVPTAGAAIPDDLQEAIVVASRNIRSFHAAQKEPVRVVETTPGVRCWRKSVPIERVGLYIPGGTAPLFSSVLMLAIPAAVAGCSEVVLCTPPGKDGAVDPAILAAAREAGIETVYRVGGAQAIAALAYGTESIPRVDKIFGPGNQWVDMAKRLVAADGVAIDLPAGPTEVGILIDASARPDFVASDILSQAEHGADSDVFVVATEVVDTEAILAAVDSALGDMPRGNIARKALEHSRLVICGGRQEAVALMDAYAPEHLIIQTHHAAALAEEVTQAGSVFIGPWTPESLGDYASGTNHTLPTNGAARAWGGVSLDSFVRKITFQEASADGLERLGPHVEIMARAEQLEGHARAVSVRRVSRDGGQPAEGARGVSRKGGADTGRTGFVRRKTNETDIVVQVDLDGSGRAQIETGLSFFDHMLDQIARHARIDLTVRCDGDLEVDEHHTIEDTALALGSALDQALGERRGINRYGFTAPMDEALSQVAIDFSGRSWLVWNVAFTREYVGDVPTEMFAHFFKSLSDTARMNLNIQASGENEHHIIESVFKGFARALGMAIRPTGTDDLPSTKGSL